jgi:hypothetical protein
MKKISLLFTCTFFFSFLQSQNTTLYVTGTVLADEKMLVTVRGTKTIEGTVVQAERNGMKTEARTDQKGHAILDFSAISAGLVREAIVVIKTFDANGKLIASSNTTVQPPQIHLSEKPVLDPLPKNIANGDPLLIPGKNLGSEAKLTCGDKQQETLAASDREMTVITNTNPGEQPLYVTTPNGVSENQHVNVYALDFSLPKNTIKPRELVQAQVHYESIPVGTKLIFTNKSTESVRMTIPGAQNTANECIYEVRENKGTIPVNITGLKRGGFKIVLDPKF